MRTALRWLGYLVCWVGLLIVLTWFGLVIYGIAVVEGWV